MVRVSYLRDALHTAHTGDALHTRYNLGRLRQLTRSLRLQKGVCAMAERESSYPGVCLLVPNRRGPDFGKLLAAEVHKLNW